MGIQVRRTHTTLAPQCEAMPKGRVCRVCGACVRDEEWKEFLQAVGDSSADMAMAARAGIRSILVRTGEGGRDGKWPGEPTFTADTVADAVNIILSVQNDPSSLLEESAQP